MDEDSAPQKDIHLENVFITDLSEVDSGPDIFRESFLEQVTEVDEEEYLAEEEVKEAHEKTISRASSRSRKSRAESTKSGPQDKSSESDSDSEEAQPQKDILLEPDFTGLDIQDDKAFDTDLEVEDTVTTYDHSGKTAYIERCKRLGVVPASYFLRHIHDKELSMKHHGLGSDGMKAMAASLASYRYNVCSVTV